MRGAPVGRRRALLLGLEMGLLGGLILALYGEAFGWMVRQWAHKEDYQYCFLIPPFVLWLLWEQRGRLARTPRRPSWWGLGALLGGVGLLLVGELAGEFFTLYLSFWLVVVGLVWASQGWARLRAMAFPLALVLTMFPLPVFLYNQLSVRLQLLSSALGVRLLGLLGVPALREGNVIDLGPAQLQVVEACSGLRYLIPLGVLSLVCAHYLRASAWRRALLVAASVPLAIGANGVRIAITGLLAERFGMEVAEGFFHGFSGWLIFMGCFGALVGMMRLLRQEAARGAPAPPEAPRPAAGGATGWPQRLAALGALGAALAVLQGVEFRERVPPRRPLAEFPLEVDGWRGRRLAMEERFVRTLDLSDYALLDYRDAEGHEVNFYVAYYESQSKGRSIHSPRSCMPGAGWHFGRMARARLRGPRGPVEVNLCLLSKPGQRMVMVYWYQRGERVLLNAYQLKMYVFWDALTRHRTDGALVRMLTPVYPGEGVRGAQRRLLAFAQRIAPVLWEFLPPPGPRP